MFTFTQNGKKGRVPLASERLFMSLAVLFGFVYLAVVSGKKQACLKMFYFLLCVVFVSLHVLMSLVSLPIKNVDVVFLGPDENRVTTVSLDLCLVMKLGSFTVVHFTVKITCALRASRNHVLLSKGGRLSRDTYRFTIQNAVIGGDIFQSKPV